jgi:hypothetical protein
MLHKFVTTTTVCALFILCFSCAGSKHSGAKDTLPGTWQAQPIVIDGDSKDWPSPYPNYDAKAMVAYATSNDKQNLYITMETGDELTQMKILKQGMDVIIDTNGKKDGQLSINYPLENDNEDIDLKRDAMAKKDPNGYESRKLQQKINNSIQSANQFTLEGFSSCNGGYVVTQSAPCGIKVRARIDEYKELVWEAVVPFKMIYNRDSISASDAGKPISVCFLIKPFVHEKKPDSNGGGSGNGGSMSNGMGGAGRNSNMGGGGKNAGKRPAQDPLEHMYEKTKTWKQLVLASQ